MSALRPLVIALAAAAPLSGPALGSAPYPATVTGCVTNGALIGGFRPNHHYTMRPTRRGTNQPVDLSAYEGRRIKIFGDILPGDRFIVDGEAVVVLGPCNG